MANKRLALNTEGQMTYCSSSEENIGKGRCNHIEHQRNGESNKEFINRTMFPKSKEAQAAKKEDDKKVLNSVREFKPEEDKTYFPATVQVQGFDHNGTVFIKAKDMDEAYQKLNKLTNPKDTDFVDIFAGPEIEDKNNYEDDYFYSNKTEFDNPMMMIFDLYEAFYESREKLDKEEFKLNFSGSNKNLSYNKSGEYINAQGLNNEIKEQEFETYQEANRWLKSELLNHDNSQGYGVGQNDEGKIIGFYGYGE